MAGKSLGVRYATECPPAPGTALAAPPRVLSLREAGIHADLSVAELTLRSDSLQTICLHVVIGESSAPVPEATAQVISTYEDGAARLEMPPTDANGISGVSFPSPPAPPGTTVMVEAQAVWSEAVTSLATIYLQW